MALKVGDLIPIGGGGYSLLSNVEDLKVDSVGDKFIEISWKDPEDVVVDGITITEWAGTQIRIKKGNYPSNEKDGTLVLDSKVRNQYQNNPYKMTGLDNDDEYFIMAFPHTDKNVFTVDSANRISATPSPYDDPSGSPGSPYLIAGDMNAGFFGEVAASELFTASEIANECGISQGTVQFENEPWLKFAIDGKIIFRPRKSIRHSISWRSINIADCVYGGSGGKRVTKNGQTYIVRLMKGALTDPSKFNATDRGAKGSEWNRLMLPIHEQTLDDSWAYPKYVEDNVPIWNHNFGTGANGMYTDADLMTHSKHGDGSRPWCQETENTDAANRVYRGLLGVSYSDKFPEGTDVENFGWSPVLELVS